MNGDRAMAKGKEMRIGDLDVCLICKFDDPRKGKEAKIVQYYIHIMQCIALETIPIKNKTGKREVIMGLPVMKCILPLEEFGGKNAFLPISKAKAKYLMDKGFKLSAGF